VGRRREGQAPGPQPEGGSVTRDERASLLAWWGTGLVLFVWLFALALVTGCTEVR
jgi:hypothetical protein